MKLWIKLAVTCLWSVLNKFHFERGQSNGIALQLKTCHWSDKIMYTVNQLPIQTEQNNIFF